ncbi:MAG: Ldh family oxidoreductase [Pyramidobacter sp.]|nr:Ldh family oxidoreductase [Pyramidobacter sp.]
MSVTYPYEELVRKTNAVLRSFGYTEEEASLTARVLVEADARGVPSHGVGRLGPYSTFIENKFINPGRMPEVVFETPVSLVIDGHNGVGGLIADFAVSRTIEKAAAFGTAFCAVRDASHYGMAGLWTERIAQSGMIGFSCCTTRCNAIPTGGKTRLFGTDPISVAIPEENGTMFLLDMATTTAAFGKVEVYARRGKTMPEGWAVDSAGRTQRDPAAFLREYKAEPGLGGLVFLGGASEETGGHKGYGLGLLVELLSAGLSLGTWSLHSYTKGVGAKVCMFFGALRLDLFGNERALRAHIGEILREVRQSEPADEGGRIYIHGEKEREARERSLRDGVVLDDASAAALEKFYARGKETL